MLSSWAKGGGQGDMKPIESVRAPFVETASPEMENILQTPLGAREFLSLSFLAQ